MICDRTGNVIYIVHDHKNENHWSLLITWNKSTLRNQGGLNKILFDKIRIMIVSSLLLH